MDLKEKLLKCEAKVGVIGLGYVGVPLAVELARVGFEVLGLDVDEDKIIRLNRGESVFDDVKSEDISRLIESGQLSLTTDFSHLKNLDVIIICVPTPLSSNKEPDLSFIRQAGEAVAGSLREGQLVILESTTYPGTTEEVLLPILERDGLKVGEDFHLAYSPERIDPGNRIFTTREIPKVVGGVTPGCKELARGLYEKITPGVFLVSSARVAEMAKLLENIFRNVNIALVNELALLCDRMGVDIWEVIEAAASKPFGFMTFYPGPGVGGHCIPVDPFYLSWKAREYDFYTHFIELAAEVNDGMPYYVVNKIMRILRADRAHTPTVLILGVAFKEDIDDFRNSPALKVMELLKKEGIEFSYNDPYISKVEILGEEIVSSDLEPALIDGVDLVVLLTAHSKYDYKMIANRAKRIFDTRNAFKKIGERENIIRI